MNLKKSNLLIVTHWRGCKVEDMTKEDLIYALSDAHDLWRSSCNLNIQDLVAKTKERFI